MGRAARGDRLMPQTQEQVLDRTPEGRRARADYFQETCIEPLRQARDHAHWLSVMRRSATAKLLEGVLEAALRMAYHLKGQLARGDE